jgi:AraC-like DNA-binding protein
MDICREVTIINNEKTRLWGRNVGPYPLHRFYVRHAVGEALRLPLRLHFTGWDEWAEGCERRRRNSAIFAIEYVREGRFEFVQDGRRRLVEPGGVFLVQPGGTSMMRTPDAKAFKRTMIIEGACLNTVLASCGLASLDLVEDADSKLLDSCFDRAEELFREARPGFMREASAVVYETLLALGEAAGRHSQPEPLRKALELFESKMASKLSMAEISAYCSCSPVTLQRLFKKHLKESPMERFIGMKMELAKGLLRISSEPIKEIARRLGYSNQLYFSTEFRKRAGVGPREFRLRSGNEDTF